MRNILKGISVKKNKSILKIILVLLGAFALYGTITGISAYRTTLESNYENVRRQAEVTVDSVDRNMSMIRGTMIALSGSDSIVKWRNDNDYFNTAEKGGYLGVEDLSNEMQRALIYNNGWNMDLFEYVAIYEEDRLLSYTYTKPLSIWQMTTKSLEICKQVMGSDEYFNIFAPSEEDPTMYTTLRVQSDFKGGRSLYIIGATSQDTLGDDLINMTGYEKAVVDLVKNDGTIFSSNEAGKLGTAIRQDILEASKGGESVDMQIDGVNYSVTRLTVNNDFSLIYLLPTREIMHQTILSLRSLMLLMLIMTLVMALIVTAIETGYETRLLKEETELRFLQNQMNPHFLFNILFTIQIKAQMSGNEEVSRMITSLSNLLRAGIYGDKRTKIKISEELKYVEYYLSLQKERYEDRLTYQIIVENEDALECEIPRLSIEPLVENAIVHGIEEIDKEGVAKVIVSTDDSHVYVHVVDNGIGFDVNKLKDDKDILNADGTVKREKVGLKNTDRRLKLIYGNEYGVKVESTPGEGTDVSVVLPKRKWLMR